MSKTRKWKKLVVIYLEIQSLFQPVNKNEKIGNNKIEFDLKSC